MIIYLIKSAVCLMIVYGIYMLVFSKEKMYVHNRFFLLIGLIASYIIPLITVGYVSKHDTATIRTWQYTLADAQEPLSTLATITWYQTHGTSILIGIYCTIAFFSLIRFFRNIMEIKTQISENIVLCYKSSNLVLIPDLELPHTFGNYIFINATDYYDNSIEPALLRHELVHARQKHSIDVILIELIQILFWFNPLLILYKRAVKLNHEYEADQGALQNVKQVRNYQQLLLSKASHNNQVHLASNLNYLVTKKRLTMMTKNTSRQKTFFISALSFPLLFVLLMTFGNRITAQTKTEDSTPLQISKAEYYEQAKFEFTDTNGNRIFKMYHALTEEQKDALPNELPPPPPAPPGVRESPHHFEHPPLSDVTIKIRKNGQLTIRKDNGGLAIPPPPPPAPAAPPAPPKAPNHVLPPLPPTAPIAPPAPPSPEEYVQEMIEQGATFMLGDKKISNQKALELVQDSDALLSIKSMKKNGNEMVIQFKEKK